MSIPDVVIVSAKRTPIGTFLGALTPLSAVQLGTAAIKAAIETAGIAAGDVQEVIMGCVLSAGLGPGARAPGSARRRRPARRSRDHHKQDVRLGTEGRDDGRRPDPLRHRRCSGRRRVRVDEQCSVPAPQGPQRLPHGSRGSHRSHAARWTAEPVRRQGDGLFRGLDRRQLPLHACRRRTRSRPSRCAARCRRCRRASSTSRSRRSPSRRVKRRDRGGARRDPRYLRPRQDPQPQARVRQGRDRDRRQLVLDRRRRGGAGGDERRRSRPARA